MLVMPDEEYEARLAAYKVAKGEYKQHMKERESLVDAAREAMRTFDQAILAFGSAIFAGSIAFLKDVAPRPQPYSLKWLGLSWALFTAGLLCVMLSFVFSHKACMFDIGASADAIGKPTDHKRPENPFSPITARCNSLCIVFLVLGMVSWAAFALENLAKGAAH
jgi:hypothetical protein